MATPNKPDEKFDVRVLQHRLRRGVVTEKDYQKYLDALPDDSEELAETSTRFQSQYARRQSTED